MRELKKLSYIVGDDDLYSIYTSLYIKMFNQNEIWKKI